MFLLKISEAVLVGSLLAAVLVAIWEGAYLVMAPRSTLGATLVQVVVPIMAFWSLDALGVLHVPLGAWLALLATWNILEEAPSPSVRVTGDVLLGFAAILTPHDVSTFPSHLWALGWVVVVALASLIRRRRALLVGLVGVLATGAASVAFSLDPVRDSLTSVVAGAWLYTFMWYQKQHQAVVDTQRHQAFTDALTGAFTRHGWADWYARWPQGSLPEGVIAAVDMDNFKWINDTYGHQTGDVILQQFTTRLTQAVRSGAQVVRSGGDEFQVWMPHLAERDARGVVERLHRAVTKDPYVIESGRLQLGVTMGYAVGPLTTETAEAADQALLQAKRAGKNRVAQAGAPAVPLVDPAHASLNWLVETAHALGTNCHEPVAVVAASGELLHHNAAFKPVAQAVLDAVPITGTEPWWGTVPLGPGRQASGAAMPIIQDGAVVGHWVALDPKSFTAPVSVLDGTTIRIVFQPIVDLTTMAVMGYEALSRLARGQDAWNPVDFFETARRQGEMVAVDAACLAAVGATLATIDWPPRTRLFVNVHPETVADPVFAEHQATLAARFPHMAIVWELSEHGDAQALARARSAVHAPALSWAMDDLGVGEADLYRLAVWPWSWIKLDRALTSRLPSDSRMRALVQSVVAWARETGVPIIAEGIETQTERQAVEALGITLGQGFLWQKPDEWEAVRPDAPLIVY